MEETQRIRELARVLAEDPMDVDARQELCLTLIDAGAGPQLPSLVREFGKMVAEMKAAREMEPAPRSDFAFEFYPPSPETGRLIVDEVNKNARARWADEPPDEAL